MQETDIDNSVKNKRVSKKHYKTVFESTIESNESFVTTRTVHGLNLKVTWEPSRADHYEFIPMDIDFDSENPDVEFWASLFEEEAEIPARLLEKMFANHPTFMYKKKLTEFLDKYIVDHDNDCENLFYFFDCITLDITEAKKLGFEKYYKRYTQDLN